VLIGEAMVALNVIIDKFFAGFMGRGSVTLLEYADRAQMIPKTLLESTLVVVAFNAWAVARAQGNDAERRRAVASTLWWILLLAPPVLAGMAIGRVALVRMLYEGGAFDPANTGMTADVLAGFTPGILFGLLGALIVKAHVVEQRFSLVMRLGFLSFAINAGLNVVLGGLLGLPGLALSTSLTTAVVTVVSFTYLAPDLSGTAGSAAVRDVAAVAGGSALLAIAAMIAGFAPARVTEGALWIASVPCFVLLGYGLRQVRRGLPA
jgi:putative peptidoglycan lipid II flippase